LFYSINLADALSLSPIEQLLALADEKTLELAREKIGKENLGLDIATAISGLCGSGDKIDVKVVAKAFGVSERQARNENIQLWRKRERRKSCRRLSSFSP